MRLLRRHKSVLIALGIYWPVIFWLTHIQMNDIARQSGMSDKTMHVGAYFILTFLVWFSVSPYEKVKWNLKKVWILLGIVICYGAMDEYLQGRVGRSPEVLDFFADLLGAILALGILSIFGFWSSLLTASAVFVFIVSNKSDLLLLYPQYHFNTVFHFTAYIAFALIWIQHSERYNPQKIGTVSWMVYSISAPLVLLALIKATAPLCGQPVWWLDIATALFGIVSAVIISGVTVYWTRRKNSGA